MEEEKESLLGMKPSKIENLQRKSLLKMKLNYYKNMSLAYCMSKKVASLNKKNRKAKKIETVVVFMKGLKL